MSQSSIALNNTYNYPEGKEALAPLGKIFAIFIKLLQFGFWSKTILLFKSMVTRCSHPHLSVYFSPTKFVSISLFRIVHFGYYWSGLALFAPLKTVRVWDHNTSLQNLHYIQNMSNLYQLNELFWVTDQMFNNSHRAFR